jgi:hypothetical protein
MAKDAQTARDEVFAKLASFGLLKDQSELPEEAASTGVCKTAAVSATGLADELDAFLKTAGADETGAFTEDSQNIQNDQGQSQNAKNSTDGSSPDSHDAPLGAGDSKGGEGLDGGKSNGMSQSVTDSDQGASQNGTNNVGDGDTDARTLPGDGTKKLAETSANAGAEDGASSIAKADLHQKLDEGKSPQDETSEGKTGDEQEADGPTSNSIEGVGASTSDRTHQVEDEEKTAATETDDDSEGDPRKGGDEDEQGGSEGEDDDDSDDDSKKEVTLKLSKEAQAIETELWEAYMEAKEASLKGQLMRGAVHARRGVNKVKDLGAAGAEKASQGFNTLKQKASAKSSVVKRDARNAKTRAGQTLRGEPRQRQVDGAWKTYGANGAKDRGLQAKDWATSSTGKKVIGGAAGGTVAIGGGALAYNKMNKQASEAPNFFDDAIYLDKEAIKINPTLRLKSETRRLGRAVKSRAGQASTAVKQKVGEGVDAVKANPIKSGLIAAGGAAAVGGAGYGVSKMNKQASEGGNGTGKKVVGAGLGAAGGAAAGGLALMGRGAYAGARQAVKRGKSEIDPAVVARYSNNLVRKTRGARGLATAAGAGAGFALAKRSIDKKASAETYFDDILFSV